MAISKERFDIRAKILSITRHDIQGLVTGKAKITNIPEDAVLIRMGYSLSTDSVNLVITHESYPAINHGYEIPALIAECVSIVKESK